MKFQTRLVVVLACLVPGLGVSVWAQNPAPTGTWKLNLAKSRFGPGQSPTSLVMKIEAAGMATTTTVDRIGPDGFLSHWAYTAGYDGKVVPITGDNPSGLTGASQKRINATTTETTFKMGGRLRVSSTLVLSADGTTLTITEKGTDARGRPTSSVQVFDKQ